MHGCEKAGDVQQPLCCVRKQMHCRADGRGWYSAGQRGGSRPYAAWGGNVLRAGPERAAGRGGWPHMTELHDWKSCPTPSSQGSSCANTFSFQHEELIRTAPTWCRPVPSSHGSSCAGSSTGSLNQLTN